MTSMQDSLAAMSLLRHTSPAPAAAAIPTPAQGGGGSTVDGTVGGAFTFATESLEEDWKISGELGHLKP